ncbi:hypothetical protein EK599_18760 [Vibrio sp. T187]|uniref:hypothetical protein n=1 Tax=Vibrio TaxID=662 RepID=UPI0010C9BCD8|nr:MULTISPECIES: hypothetical protein [Vibrio]MBW3697725.1 hypothetical protein [Vibrio sp. T187]
MDFTITRIHTQVGIFKLKGDISVSCEVCYSSAEFMGSDGWVEIDLKSEYGKSVLSKIESDVVRHLRG